MAAPKFRTGNSSSTDSGFLIVMGLLSASLIFLVPYLAAGRDRSDANQQTLRPGQGQSLKGLPPSDLSEDEAIAHVLNRLGYGPRPGDVERIKAMGVAKWIDEQLHPESIHDAALESRLSRFPTLSMSSEALLQKFPPPQVAAKREGITPQEYRKEQQQRLQAARQARAGQGQPGQMVDAPSEQGSEQSDSNHANADGAQSGSNVSPQSTSPQTSSPQTMAPDELAAILLPGAKNGKGQNGPGNQMMNFEAIQTPQRVVAELAMAKMDRAVYSERQLDEQMVDFWFNHFNVFAAKGADRWLITSYERDAIRPHAMGKFRDLLEATAKSPAMLFYLDNWQSVDPDAWARLQQEQAARQAYRGRFGGPFGRAAFSRCQPESGQEETRTRTERKLRPRADGTAHAGRGWRLHAGRRDRRGAQLHRLDHSPATARPAVLV